MTQPVDANASSDLIFSGSAFPAKNGYGQNGDQTSPSAKLTGDYSAKTQNESLGALPAPTQADLDNKWQTRPVNSSLMAVKQPGAKNS